MAPAHRDFDAGRREQTGEPLTFSLGGETFTVPRPLPALPMMELAAAASEEGQTEDLARSAAAFSRFLLGMLASSDRERFRKMATAIRADVELLGAIVQWVVEEMSGRPTEAPSDSRGLRSVSSPPSTGAYEPPAASGSVI